MAQFSVVGFACFVLSLITKMQASNDYIELDLIEPVNIKLGEYNKLKNCIEIDQGHTEICMESVPLSVKAKMEQTFEDLDTNLLGVPTVNVGSRGGFGLANACDLCLHRVSLKYEPTVLNFKDKKMYVVQTNKIQQRFNIQLCQSEKMQERSACVSAVKQRNLSQDTVMGCAQKHSEVTILLYDAKHDSLNTTSLRYPSECVCAMNSPFI